MNTTTNDNSLLKGKYILAETTGGITTDNGVINVAGLNGQPFHITVEGNNIVLTIDGSREPSENVAWKGSEDSTWDYTTANFTADGTQSTFVKGDKVTFNDEASTRVVNVNSVIMPTSVNINTQLGYTFNGNGAISGTATVVKEGDGELIMNLNNNDSPRDPRLPFSQPPRHYRLYILLFPDGHSGSRLYTTDLPFLHSIPFYKTLF